MTRRPRITLSVVATVTALSGALAAGAAAAPDATPALAPLTATDSDTAIAGEYIVVLHEVAALDSTAAVSSAAADAGAVVHDEWDTAVSGFSATLDADALDAVRADPRVAYVEANQKVSATDTQTPTPSWGLDRIDQAALPLDDSYTYATTGAGVTAYIVDTGIRSTHEDFGGRVRSGYDAIGDGNGTEDCAGHGTHVAGTVGGESYGVAKDVDLVAVRVLGCDGGGTTAGVIAGVDFVTEDASGASVANMSLGGGVSATLDDAVAAAVDAGVAFAVAAGNENGADACSGSPSGEESAITVGSTTSTDAASDFSNVGSCVDIQAPGSEITSAWNGDDTDENTISGTSMATPHVAGAAALLLESTPEATPAEILASLEGAAIPDVVTGLPSGTANLLLNVGEGDPGDPGEPTACVDSDTVATGTVSAGERVTGAEFTSAGDIEGCLSGADGTDFDLYLEVQNGSAWEAVASSLTWSSDESISYSGAAGDYRLVVHAYSGSGDFTVGYSAP